MFASLLCLSIDLSNISLNADVTTENALFNGVSTLYFVTSTAIIMSAPNFFAKLVGRLSNIPPSYNSLFNLCPGANSPGTAILDLIAFDNLPDVISTNSPFCKSVATQPKIFLQSSIFLCPTIFSIYLTTFLPFNKPFFNIANISISTI